MKLWIQWERKVFVISFFDEWKIGRRQKGKINKSTWQLSMNFAYNCILIISISWLTGLLPSFIRENRISSFFFPRFRWAMVKGQWNDFTQKFWTTQRSCKHNDTFFDSIRYSHFEFHDEIVGPKALNHVQWEIWEISFH